MGDSNAEKWGDYQKKKLFINNSTKAVILFKEKHQGLLKLHVPLGEGGVPVSPSNECWGCPQTNFNSQISTSYYHHHHYHQEFTKTEGSIFFTKTYPTYLKSLRIALLLRPKLRSARGGSCHPAIMGNCLLVTRVSLIYLVDEFIFLFLV